MTLKMNAVLLFEIFGITQLHGVTTRKTNFLNRRTGLHYIKYFSPVSFRVGIAATFLLDSPYLSPQHCFFLSLSLLAQATTRLSVIIVALLTLNGHTFSVPSHTRVFDTIRLDFATVLRATSTGPLAIITPGLRLR